MRICAESGWWCSFGKKKNRKASAPAIAAHDDLVRRQFNADAPNQIWLADLSEHRTSGGKAYLRTIKDMFSNRIVGWIERSYRRHRRQKALRRLTPEEYESNVTNQTALAA